VPAHYLLLLASFVIECFLLVVRALTISSVPREDRVGKTVLVLESLAMHLVHTIMASICLFAGELFLLTKVSVDVGFVLQVKHRLSGLQS